MKRFILFLSLFTVLDFTLLHADSAQGLDSRALRILSRCTFGPSSREVQRISKKGRLAFLEEQLHPEKLSEDPRVEAFLRKTENLHLSIRDLLYKYPDPAGYRPGSETLPRPLTEKQIHEAYASHEEMLNDLFAAKAYRALYSPRQLEEIMVDFWFNHFNVSFEKDAVKWCLISYEQDAIRPHALGYFPDLLLAVAKHPAMLLYLDNVENQADPEATRALPAKTGNHLPKPPRDPRLVLNENYARELLELHTLGVDGGYTQRDVEEAARILTGWGVQGLSPDAAPMPVRFRFRPWAHDQGEKEVLGRIFHPSGMQEGEALLKFLALHPSTARHLAEKLCRRFVSDSPPPSLVGKTAKAYLSSGGHIPTTLKALFTSEEFFDDRFAKKWKTPLEYVFSVLRILDVKVERWEPILQALSDMGMAPYRCAPPTGYPTEAEAWQGPMALRKRTEFLWMLWQQPKSGAFSLPEPFQQPKLSVSQGLEEIQRTFTAAALPPPPKNILQEYADRAEGDGRRAALLCSARADLHFK